MRKRNSLLRALTPVLLVVALGLTEGCTLAKISGRGAIPIMLNTPQQRVQLVRSVEVKKMRAFDYTSSFDVSEVLGDVIAMTDADAIINIAITVRTTPLDWLVNLITLGLANSRTMYVTGDVVRVKEDLVSITPDGTKTLARSEDVSALFARALEQPAEPGYAHAIVRLDDGRYGLVTCAADAFE
jgi:hypothetical protein